MRTRRLGPGQILFRAGDPGDALYIVASGKVEILEGDQPIANLGEGEGEAFGEMALLSGSSRTATVRSASDVELLEIDRKDFERLIAGDQVLARAVERLSHERALNNLSAGTPGAASWATVASSSLERLSQREANKILAEGGHGSGIPIILGNILDTIPGCLVIGSTFHGWGTLSLTLMLGMFIGGIPEAAAAPQRSAGLVIAHRRSSACGRRFSLPARWRLPPAMGCLAAHTQSSPCFARPLPAAPCWLW